jgi:hypothetical protein
MPANIGMAFNFSPSLLARDEEGPVHVGHEIFQDNAHIFGEHFHRPPLAPMGSYDVLVQRFTPGSRRCASSASRSRRRMGRR